MIVAIDGPAGSGKSTTARRAAEQLGYLYLDTGAMYRAVALEFLRREAQPDDETAQTLLEEISIHVDHSNGEMRVYLNDEDVSSRIRVQEVGAMASRISSLLPVREKMVQLQRSEARRMVDKVGGVVLDGRDIGTVVLPDAPVKIFLTADDTERAKRRQAELKAKGEEISLDDVLTEIRERDRLDKEREHAPLRQAEDAVVVDTTDQTIDQQVAQVIDYIRERASETSR